MRQNHIFFWSFCAFQVGQRAVLLHALCINHESGAVASDPCIMDSWGGRVNGSSMSSVQERSDLLIYGLCDKSTSPWGRRSPSDLPDCGACVDSAVASMTCRQDRQLGVSLTTESPTLSLSLNTPPSPHPAPLYLPFIFFTLSYFISTPLSFLDFTKLISFNLSLFLLYSPSSLFCSCLFSVPINLFPHPLILSPFHFSSSLTTRNWCPSFHVCSSSPSFL